jgi:hypothetical protein
MTSGLRRDVEECCGPALPGLAQGERCGALACWAGLRAKSVHAGLVW